MVYNWKNETAIEKYFYGKEKWGGLNSSTIWYDMESSTLVIWNRQWFLRLVKNHQLFFDIFQYILMMLKFINNHDQVYQRLGIK